MDRVIRILSGYKAVELSVHNSKRITAHLNRYLRARGSSLRVRSYRAEVFADWLCDQFAEIFTLDFNGEPAQVLMSVLPADGFLRIAGVASQMLQAVLGTNLRSCDATGIVSEFMNLTDENSRSENESRPIEWRRIIPSMPGSNFLTTTRHPWRTAKFPVNPRN